MGGKLLHCEFLVFCLYVLYSKADSLHETEIIEIGLTSLIAPDNIRLNFSPLPGQRISLNLTRNRNIRNNIPIYLSKNTEVKRWENDDTLQYHAFYLDTVQKASLHMQATPRGDGSVKRKYMGMFRLDGQEYQIEPIDHTQGRSKRNSFRRTNSTRAKYSIIPIESRPEDFLPDNIRDDQSRVAPDFEREALGYFQAQDNIDETGKHHYFVEALFVLDYGTFDRMYRLGTKRNPQEREDEAIANLKYFSSHVANGIDLRFRTIDNEKYNINVRLIGLYIAMSRRDSPWTEYIKEYEDGWSNAFVNAYTALDDFEEWLNKTRPSLPNYDHAALITSYQLFGSVRNDGTHRRISGLSDIKGICTRYWPASINQDRGIYSTTQTVAHEIGHSLGAYHDGSQNTCTGTDQYIMASSPGVVTDDNYLNLFTFSPCTIDEITKHLTFLNMMGRNCLVNTVQSHYNPSLLQNHLQTPPGQLFTIDQQCQYIHQSSASYYCAGANNDRDICRVMECYHPDYRRCYSSVEQRAANGTSCGHNKWCMLSDCVEDQRAPGYPDYCWSGDYKGTFYDGRTCDQVVQESPWLCYDDKYRDACCKRCEDIRNRENDQCPYGDKSEWCEDITRRDCYTGRVKDVCCRSCDRFYTGIIGCDYGDRAGWCNTATPSTCYTNAATCCEKCSMFARQSTNEAACVYGDKATWCGTVTPEQCYTVKDTCCNTCNRYFTGIQGCEFGNIGTSCSGKDCTDPYWAQRCCQTCYHYLDHPSTSTLPPSTTRRVPTTTLPPSTTTSSTTSAPITTAPPTTTIPEPAGPVNIQCSLDEAGWCKNLPKSRCYLDNDVCCQTCPKHYTGVEGCEYGDHASWCEFIYPGSCYEPMYMRQCCTTCPKLIDFNAPIDCMYGDKYTSCKSMPVEDCELPETRRDCCKRCNAGETSSTSSSSIATSTSTSTSATSTTNIPTSTTQIPTTTTSTRATSTTPRQPRPRPATDVPSIIGYPATSTTPRQPRPQPATDVPSIIGYPDCEYNSDVSWCSDIPSSYCYSVEDSCCSRCATFWRDEPGCQYGDHFTWCRRIEPNKCYEDYYKRKCCATCLQYPTTESVTFPPACSDEMTWCPTAHAGQCYTSAELCCHTCSLAQTNVQGCEFGDHYASCESITRRECYFRSYRDSCCSTCAMLKSTDPNCPWGDRYSDCSGADCTKAKVREYCCETCTTFSSIESTTTLSPISPQCQDNATWCPTIPPNDCYVNDHICCRTCVDFYTGLPNCIYGDETSWCANVIFTIEDCANNRVGPFCCMTCASIALRAGYGLPPEPDTEIYEGVLVVLEDTDIDETLAKEPGLLEMLSIYVDEFCSIDVKKCCEMADLKERLPPPDYKMRRYRYFQKTHCHIGQGYPRNTNFNNVITKILMRFPLEFMETMCYNNTRRWKKDVTGRSQIKYVDKHLLYDILVKNELVIEQALDTKITRVLTADEDNVLDIRNGNNRDNLALTIGITALIGVIILTIILAIVIVYRRKRVREQKQKRNRTKSTAELCQPNAYTWVHEKEGKLHMAKTINDNESTTSSVITNPYEDEPSKKGRTKLVGDEYEKIAYISLHKPD